MISNSETGTRIDEIAEGIHRISTPVPPSAMPGGFSFNQYLVLDDEPLLFHTGMRAIFPLVRDAIARVMPVDRLRYLALSHFEADECGALNDFLQVAPHGVPVCGRIAASVSVGDFALRAPRALADGERLSLGSRSLRWIDTPHLPHNWETGLMFDEATQTLLCGDLFTRGGHDLPPLTQDDLVEPSEAFRLAGAQSGQPDAYSQGLTMAATFDRLAALRPRALAVMHGSAWRGRSAEDGTRMLRELSSRLAGPPAH